ncbi:MAG: TonB-dependent receptor [Halioglobus sp.]
MTSVKRISAAIIAANCATLTMLPQFASAQDRLVLEEVVVTARKRQESLQQVPIAVTAFTETQIQRAGIQRPGDFIALTPNVTMVNTVNAGDTQVTIRGQVSTRDAESSFAYVVDGVLVTNPNGFNQELFDIQQIEVLKGPQGALYGRNAVAGAIIVNTNRPDNEVEGNLKVGVGSFDLVKASGVISGPLVEDKLYGRLAASYRETEGEYKNKLTGKNGVVDYFEDTSVRGRLIWDVNSNWSLDSQLAYSEVQGGAVNFNASFALPFATGANPDFYLDVNDQDFQYIFNVPSENNQETIAFSLKSDYDLGWATMTAILAYDQVEEDLISDGTSAAFGGYSAVGGPESQAACVETGNDPALFDLQNSNSPFYNIQNGNPPGTPVDAVNAPNFLNAFLPAYSDTTCDGYQYQERNQDSTSIELKLTSGEDQSLRWVGGLYYAQLDREVVVAYGADLGLGFLAQPYVPADGPNPTDLLFWDDFDTEVMSVFGQIEFDLTDRQELAFALRWDEEQREVSNKVPNVPNAQLNNAFGPAPINPAYDGSYTDTIPDRKETFDQLQPKVSWRWQATEDLSTYASYGVGFRSGGFNSLGSEDTVNDAFGSFDTAPQEINDDYDKEVSETFEIGLKSDWWNQRLRINAAIFHTEIEDNQFFNFYAGSFGLLRVVSNIDEVTLQGYEVDFQALLTDGLSFYGSYGYVDSEINKNSNRPYTEGNDAPMAPDSTANLGIQWIADLSDNMALVTRLDWSYVGDTWFHTVQDNDTTNSFTDLTDLFGPGWGFGPSNYKLTQRDAYDTLNLRVSLEGVNWIVTAWGANITDEEYLEEVIPAPEFGGSFNHPASTRTYGLDLSYRF